MRILMVLVACLIGFDVGAMDYKKIYKVTLQPKKIHYRKMDEAIYVQMPQVNEHKYLHSINHPCCKDVPRK